MSIETSYSAARANLAKLMDAAVDDRETVIIRRRKGGDVALIALQELEGLLETLHLLRSPRNAERLFRALEQSRRNEGKESTVDELREELGLVAPA